MARITSERVLLGILMWIVLVALAAMLALGIGMVLNMYFQTLLWINAL